jgi:hypothetical protein
LIIYMASASSFSLAAAASGAQAAFGAASTISASTAQLLTALDVPASGEKRTAESAGLATSAVAGERAGASGRAADVMDAMQAAADGEKGGGLVALVRVDGLHIAGDLLLEEHIDRFAEGVASTQQCLKKSNSMAALGSSKFTLINGSLASSTCIIINLECHVTAEAMLIRFAAGGIKVLEEGKAIFYKATCGRQWYMDAEKKEAEKNDTSDLICLIYRGLPDPKSTIPFYTAHGEDYYGTLAKPAVVNSHEFGGVKSLYSDGSLTLVFHNEKGVNRIADTPLMLDGDIQVGYLSLSKRRIHVPGTKVCNDDECRGFGGFHLNTCKRRELEKKSKINRSVAVGKSFSQVMQDNAKQLGGVRKLLKAKYDGKLCKNFDRKGIPCKADCCSKGPCCDWDELIECELAKSIYVDMPDSIRTGKPQRQRGVRGGRKIQEVKAKARRGEEGDVSEDEESMEESEGL